MQSRICEYCGKPFQGTNNQRYCCPECSVLGAKKKRQEYLKNHPERLERQREYNREHRKKLKAVEDELYQSHIDEIIEPISIDSVLEELKQKAASGDINARCRLELLTNGNATIEYWTAYKLKELPICEERHNIRIVNDVSVFDDLFEEKVVDSIKERQLIRSELVSIP